MHPCRSLDCTRFQGCMCSVVYMLIMLLVVSSVGSSNELASGVGSGYVGGSGDFASSGDGPRSTRSPSSNPGQGISLG